MCTYKSRVFGVGFHAVQNALVVFMGIISMQGFSQLQAFFGGLGCFYGSWVVLSLNNYMFMVIGFGFCTCVGHS